MLKGREGWRSLFCPCQVTLQWPSVNCAPTVSTELFSGLGLGGSHRQCPGQAPVVFSTTHTHEDWFTNGHTRKRWLLGLPGAKRVLLCQELHKTLFSAGQGRETQGPFTPPFTQREQPSAIRRKLKFEPWPRPAPGRSPASGGQGPPLLL